jgi:hypothetical protein
MSQSGEPSSPQSLAADLTTPSPAEVRTSKQRAEEIKQYILGLLPAHISKTVDVVITENVPTAAVLPATEDALLTDDRTGFSRQQARSLIESVDGDYLVLITGHETPDAGPLNDELSADRAHQFGLAFHETLHILKTAFAGVQTLLSKRVDDEYQNFVHDLINATEDGAIEHEVYVGDDFSKRAGNRLRLVREIHKRSPEDYEDLPAEQTQFTFRDALQKAIHDNVILPPSGTTSALLDEDDDRVTFDSDETRAVFEQIYPEIEALADDIHSIRGDVDTGLHRNDLGASIRRAKRTIQFWADVVKPILNEGDGDDTDQQASGREQGSSQEQGQTQERGQPQTQNEPHGEESAQARQNDDRPDSPQQPDEGAESSPGPKPEGASGGAKSQSSMATSNSDEGSSQNAGGEVAASDVDVDPEDLSLDQNAVSDSLQGVADHPPITNEPKPDGIDLSSNQSESDDVAGGGEAGADSDESKPDNGEQDAGVEGSERGGVDSSSDGVGNVDDSHGEDDTGDSSGPAPGGDGSSPETADDTSNESSNDGSGGDGGASTSVEVESSSAASDLASSTQASAGSGGQSTFGDFASEDSSDSVGSEGESGEPSSESAGKSGGDAEGVDGGKAEHQSSSGDETTEQPESGAQTDATPEPGTDAQQSETQQEADAGQATTGRSSTQSNASPSQTATSSQDASGNNQTHSDDATSSESSAATNGVSGPDHEPDDLTAEDFESDRKRAQQTAESISGDTNGLENELRQLDSVLGDEVEQNPDNDKKGSGAGAGSVDELEVLPSPESSSEPAASWSDIERNAGAVADTLAKQLRLDQQTERRSGLSSGTKVNRKAAYRLGHNDPRVFEETIPGDKKEYFVVIVLDRSGSMDPTYLGRSSSSGDMSKIDVATSAVARFAVACEDLGIDVAVVDFYNDTARLAKPASVEAEYAQGTLLSKDAGGGTPLADALSLSGSLAEMDAKESIIISITDGKPRDVEATEDVIKGSYTPVCSLTIATDCEQGNPPEKTEQLEDVYDQSTTVFDPAKLDSRIDELASLLGAY